jgi:hypothetical protein
MRWGNHYFQERGLFSLLAAREHEMPISAKEQTSGRRAGYGKSASPVRREGRGKPMPHSYPYTNAVGFSIDSNGSPTCSFQPAAGLLRSPRLSTSPFEPNQCPPQGHHHLDGPGCRVFALGLRLRSPSQCDLIVTLRRLRTFCPYPSIPTVGTSHPYGFPGGKRRDGVADSNQARPAEARLQ